MDTITQALLGATVAEAGFRRRLGGKAVLFGAACGVLPDLDVVAGLAGEWASLVHHRGVSHSLVVLPLAAPLVGWLGSRVFGGSRDRPAWIALAFWALITHPLLDLFTAYGTQLFAPISTKRYSLDGVAIIDLIYTVPLAVAVWRRSRTFAIGALLFTTLYLAAGFAIGRAAKGDARAQLEERGFEPVAVRAVVPAVFPVLRRIVARDQHDDLRVGIWSPFRDRIDFVELERVHDPLVDRALATEEGRIFAWFADGFLFAVVERGPDGATVELWDERYGMFVHPERGPFRVTMRFDGRGDLASVERGPRISIELGEELATGWNLLVGASGARAR